MSQCRQINFWIDQEENKVFVRLIMKTWLKKKKYWRGFCAEQGMCLFLVLYHTRLNQVLMYHLASFFCS